MKISLRSMFVAPKDHVLIHWDLAQAESWIVAYLANEENMKRSLKEGDIHLDTAAFALYFCEREAVTPVMRYMGKQSNHSLSYRMSANRWMQLINKRSDRPPHVTVTLGETKTYHKSWNTYYNLRGWWSEIDHQLSIDRILVTPYGRVRVFFEAWGDDLFKEGTAHVPQSTVADHFDGAIHPDLGIKGGMLEVYNQFVKTNIFKIVNQGHDSLTAEVHKSLTDDVIEPVTQLIRRPLIVNDEQFTIPVDCAMGEVFGELEEAKLAA